MKQAYSFGLNSLDTNMQQEIQDEDLVEEPQSMEEEIVEEIDLVAENIIKSHVIASMALGLVPVPIFDIAALTTTQLSLLKKLCEYYDVPFDNFDLKSLLTSLVGGSLPIISVVGLSSLVKAIPGLGSIAGMASLSITAGSVTYAVGKVFSKHFESGGTIEDFDPKQAQQLLKSEFEYGKSVVRSIKDEEEGLDSSSEVKKA